MPRFFAFARKTILATSLIAMLPGGVAADAERYWMHKNSQHFSVVYDKSTAYLSEKALRIAESTFARLTGYFGWTWNEEIIDIALFDDEEYSNGASYGRTPLVRIDCRKVPIPWRAETKWLETVLSHELSHTYTLMQWQRPMEFSVLWTWHSDLDRQDRMGALQTGTDELPVWFVEGIAQIGSNAFGADHRDPLRDALLADAYHGGMLLGLSEMSHFEGTSREYELAYNQGFDFLLFLQKRYPNVDFRKLCQKVSADGFGFAFNELYGATLPALFADWKASLAERFPVSRPEIVGKRVINGKSGAFVFEAGASGRYAVANWKHDYQRNDLFKIDGKGSPHRVARDVGEKVVDDPVTGSVWFTSLLRNTSRGADQYDLFRIDQNGSKIRETKGARCMAFDVVGDRLVYARYEAGTTAIVQRTVSTGTESILHRFPYDTAVYEIALHPTDSVFYAVLGSGDATRAAVFDRGNLRVLWTGMPSVLSVAPWGGDTVVFVAADSGAPCLFWDAGDGKWRRFGAREPVRSVWVDRARDGNRLVVSAMENGERHLRSPEIDGAWNAEIVETGSRSDSLSAGSAKPEVPIVRVETNRNDMVRMPFGVKFGYESYGQSDLTTSSHASDWILMLTEEIVDAANTGGVGVSGGGLLFPAGDGMPGFLPIIDLRAWLRSGDLHWNTEYVYRSQALAPKNDSVSFEVSDGVHDVTSTLAQRLSRDWLVQLNAEHYWRTESFKWEKTRGLRQSGTVDEGMITSVWAAGPEVYFQQNDSRMDPAVLGQPGQSANLLGNIYSSTFKTRGEWLPAQTIYSGKAELKMVQWLPADLASLSVRLDGYGVLGGVDSCYYYPGSILWMGGNGPFAAYPDENLRLRSWARGTMELRLSPFASRSPKVSWWDRTRLAARLEAGVIQYLSAVTGYDNNGHLVSEWVENRANAASLEVGLRQGFWGFGRREPSWFEVRYARPLVHLDAGRRDDPYRLLFALQVQ